MELNYELTAHEAKQGYVELLEEARRTVKSPVLWEVIDGLIDSGRVNADDTVFVEKAASLHEWDSIFRGSIGSLLDCNTHDSRVIAWFARRGIVA